MSDLSDHEPRREGFFRSVMANTTEGPNWSQIIVIFASVTNGLFIAVILVMDFRFGDHIASIETLEAFQREQIAVRQLQHTQCEVMQRYIETQGSELYYPCALAPHMSGADPPSPPPAEVVAILRESRISNNFGGVNGERAEGRTLVRLWRWASTDEVHQPA